MRKNTDFFAHYEKLFHHNILDLNDAIGEFEKENYKIFDENYSQTIKVFDTGTFLIFSLLLNFLEQEEYEKGRGTRKTLEFLEPERFSQKFRLSIVCFLTTLVNTLLSIKKLAKCGFDYQSRVVTRYFLETSELIIALIYNHDLYSLYMSNTDCDYKKWKNNFSPAKIRKVINDLEEGLGEDGVDLYNARKGNYSWLSKFAHNDYIALHLGSYGGDISAEGMMHFTGGGRITKGIRPTLETAMDATFIFLTHITFALCKKHKLRFCYYNDEISYLLSLELYKKMHLEYKNLSFE